MKKFLKSLFVAAMFAGSSLAAHAAPVDLSNASVDLTQDLLDYSSGELLGSFSLAAGQLAGAANNFFSDKYTFTVTGLNDLSALATSLKPSPNSGLVMTGFSLGNASGILFQGSPDLINFTAQDQAWTLKSGSTPLATGNYFLQVDGYVASAAGGSYSGNLAVTPVPEPETYGMLLAGLGLVGFAARRRKLQA
ncbi:FxDxF family PEP-CTERM protein [Janthinobacterium sp. GB4P2]|uniref:FxDxF family PEP-CTERM protein n=1 Tax=Janthinobacterium sp. GB4P2 TaxID=3424189 RepID=UPI003F1F8BC9